MGAYVYCLKSPNKTVNIKINGEVHRAGILVYSYKPLWCFWDKEPRWQILAKARIARMENLWRGRETPRYVVISYPEYKSGNTVLDWHSNGQKNCVSTYDDPDWGGRKTIGRLDENLNVVSLY